LVTIAQTLEDNAYDVDASIQYILQLMCVAEDTGMLGLLTHPAHVKIGTILSLISSFHLFLCLHIFHDQVKT